MAIYLIKYQKNTQLRLILTNLSFPWNQLWSIKFDLHYFYKKTILPKTRSSNLSRGRLFVSNNLC